MSKKVSVTVGLGDLVRDTVSGFEGIATARTQYIHGCERWSVQPKADKDGKLPEYQSFDGLALEVITPNYVQTGLAMNPGLKQTGGPEKYPDKRRY
jgi:hypothetical protein